ncbi:hypothetical protein LAZ67_4003743 [Cordylochernes scorpioides]|uniref:Integrase catalytic domain-containing protein n=1 Tax=Cordylochernes scorpioides TaxID=51811 RepID=A0ABY6KE37_9ARAC|nr:hypothetical protein LAZ67_4003743 [Cordylochernes scorpioides]
MPKQTSKVTSKKLYFEISKLDDLKIELENVEPQNKGYLKVQLDNINKIKENIENYMIALVDFDEHESHIPMYKEANKDITEIQSTLLNYLELKESDLDQWLDFKTTFEDTIINNSSLNNIQKFKYLQSSLSGDAASIIKGFSLTPDTFDKAWLALNERYHCTRDLAYKYCNNILNIKYIKVTNSRNIIELIDTVKLNLRNLELLGINEEQLGNMLLTTFILKKIDSNMNKDFELSLKENTFPTLQDLLTFLEKHRKGLDHINGKIYQKEDNVTKTFKTYQVNTNIIKCTYCNSSHKLGTCQEFAKLSLDDRIKFVRSKNLCINCLGVNHYANNCKITSTCKVCNRKHHTTLHHYNYQRRQGPISTTEHQANTSVEQNQHQTVNHTVLSNNTSILETNIFLSTALIKVFNPNNDELMCRALIDSGAQKSLITKTLADKLNITQEHTKVKISGFNTTMQSQVNKIIKVKLSSIYDHFKFETKALIVKDLSNKIPNFYTNNPVWPHLNNLKLADPEFYIPRPIDIIIGADLYLDLIEPGLIKGPRDAPSAMNSKLGWIISGRSNMPNNTTSTSIQQIHINHSSAELDDIVKKFWDAESIPTHKEEMNTEELECENIFRTTTFRDENGRYVVSLPFKLNYNKINYQLGDSKSQALRRFLSLERRFHQNPVYSQHVREFMQEYLNLGHMEVINEIEQEQPSHQVYYMPYHAVLRDQSTTTKLRVVFDASAKTSTGLSLNDLLYCGPKLQEDIFNILIKFRTYSIALTADIEKMYRQIRLNPADCCFQRILWRASPNEPIKEYQLATVTYGTTSAPYLAIKTLKTLAHDEQEQFPQAFKAILTNFYVDDMLSGANSVEEAKDLIIQLNQIMRRGGFHLRKWASNVPKVLEALPNEDKYDISMVPIEKDLTINLLGLIWNATKDVFQVKVQDTMDVNTKRQLLSVIAQFFDPLGIISPSIILLKILMQDAWKLQLDWDDYLPDDIVNLWAQFKKEIGYLSQVMIPRYLAIIPKEDEVRMQLHGFADASAKAYAAVCYLRCETQNDVKIQLLAAKTRVASLKAPTLPCLELCAAHLLSQLVDSIKLTLPFQIKETFLWTDSKITLCWIQSNPSKWKVYISNRVEKIQKTSRVDQWHHVPGVENPADCASRGIMPMVEESEIVQSYGELIQIHYSSAEDVKTHSLPDSITRFSSYNRMKRTLAWCLRFINNSRYPSNKFSGTLTTKEIRSSELKITKVVQECYFSVEINALLSSKALPKTNKLLCLNPFIDQNGILRVGGRLKLSSLSEFQKHPIILPPKSHVTELIIRQCHQEHFHSSFNLTCSILRRTYWIINGRSFVKQILKNCVQCFKVNARPNTQLMGELPSSRTTYIRAFARTGVDLAGPILTKPRLPRSRVKLKSYIALFVCFATKAIHLELVSDLSTGSFIAALRRFTSRRGTPSDIYSDNGTNFKGAAKFLNEQYAFLHASEIQDYITYSEINWHFMPPHAPHFGGIWESNIKSVKMILKKVIGSSLLTFEELTTFLTQIEATLNQRPLTPLSEDPNDLEALTPAHFLSGPSTSNLPETDNQQANLSINLSSRWKHIQELKKLFILRWKKEYVINLQKRGKWKSAKPNVKIGDLVLIMEQSISSPSWILGRVSKTFHGPDMLVRTVELRTGKLRLAYLENPKASWTQLVKRVTQTYNNTPHSVTSFPPTYLMFNVVPPDLRTHLNPYSEITRAREIERSRTQNKHEKDKETFDKQHRTPHFEVNDLVLVKNYRHPDTETLSLMNEAYEDEILSRTQVYLWYKRFKDSRKSIADDSRSDRPLTPTTDRNIGQKLTKGCPQGGPLSPLLWNILLNDLLINFDSMNADIICYADDVTIISWNKTIEGLKSASEYTLNYVIQWCNRNKLTISTEKTNMLYIHNRQKIPIKVNNNIIMPVKQVKILEMKFSNHKWKNKVNFTPHVNDILCKAGRMKNLLCSLSGNMWGLDTQKRLTLFKTIIRPVLTYGSEIWFKYLNNRCKQKLNSMQYQIILWAVRAYKTTSSNCVHSLVNIPLLTDNIESRIIEFDLAQLSIEDLITYEPHAPSLVKSFLHAKMNEIFENTNEIFRSFFVFGIPRFFRPNFYNIQFITDHGNFGKFLATIGAVKEPRCFCGGEIQDARHLLLECPIFRDFRENRFGRIGQLDEFVDKKEKYKNVDQFCKYIYNFLLNWKKEKES